MSAQAQAPVQAEVDWDDLSARASFASHRLIGWIYWDPYAVECYRRVGVQDANVSYIVSRGAPLAPAGHAAVAAAFYSISPWFIELAVTVASQESDFPSISGARNEAVGHGLRTYVPEICDGLASLAGPLWEAADALPVSGRVLFAAHRQQPRPDDQLVSAWLALNCIREWRGDTHFAVLASEDISGTQAGMLHNAFLNYEKDWIPRSRGADDAALEMAYADLRARGLADENGVNAAGLALRERIEARTDRLTQRAWRQLGAQRTQQLLDLIEPVGERLLGRIDGTAGPDWMPAARRRRP